MTSPPLQNAQLLPMDDPHSIQAMTHGRDYITLLSPEILIRIARFTTPAIILLCPQPQVGKWLQRDKRTRRDAFTHRRLLRLAAVCKAWRNVLYGCPSLWSLVELDLHQLLCDAIAPVSQGVATVSDEAAERDALASIAALLERQLARTRSVAPLRIHLRAALEDLDSAPVRLLLDYLPRARVVKIVIVATDGSPPGDHRPRIIKMFMPKDFTTQRTMVTSSVAIPDQAAPPGRDYSVYMLARQINPVRVIDDGMENSDLPFHLALTLPNVIPSRRWPTNLGANFVVFHLTIWNPGNQLKHCSFVLHRMLLNLRMPNLEVFTVSAPHSDPDSDANHLRVTPKALSQFIFHTDKKLRSLGLLNVVLGATNDDVKAACIEYSKFYSWPCIEALTVTDFAADNLLTIIPRVMRKYNRPFLRNLRHLVCYTDLGFPMEKLRGFMQAQPQVRLHLKVYRGFEGDKDAWIGCAEAGRIEWEDVAMDVLRV